MISNFRFSCKFVLHKKDKEEDHCHGNLESTENNGLETHWIIIDVNKYGIKMKKPLFIVLLSVGSFIVGLTATYLAMPVFAPQLVDEVQLHLDSQILAKQLSVASGSTMNSEVLLSDRMNTADSGPSSLPTGLHNSIQDLKAELNCKILSNDSLLIRIQNIESKWAALSAKYREARMISNTIAKMENKEAIAALLSKLDDDVIESMYVEASSRNRTILLQMLPAEKAALLIHTLTN